MSLQLAAAAHATTGYHAMAMCQGLERQAASRVVAVSSRQVLAPGQTLFAEGDTTENVYEVVSGIVKLYKLLPDGRRQVTGFLSAGHLMGLVYRGFYVYTAEAVTDVIVCRYPRARFESLIDEVPGFARRLLAIHSDELRVAQDQMLLLGRKTATERVASFLEMMAEMQGAETPSDDIHVPMSRQDIADYLGLTIETISRTLTKFDADGIIERRKCDRIRVRNADRLADLASGDMDEV